MLKELTCETSQSQTHKDKSLNFQGDKFTLQLVTENVYPEYDLFIYVIPLI